MAKRSYKVNEAKLKRLMSEQKLTAAELADKAGISGPTITQNIFSGKGVYKWTLELLAEALGVEAKELMIDDKSE